MPLWGSVQAHLSAEGDLFQLETLDAKTVTRVVHRILKAQSLGESYGASFDLNDSSVTLFLENQNEYGQHSAPKIEGFKLMATYDLFLSSGSAGDGVDASDAEASPSQSGNFGVYWCLGKTEQPGHLKLPGSCDPENFYAYPVLAYALVMPSILSTAHAQSFQDCIQERFTMAKIAFEAVRRYHAETL